jgi:hypothetical protein
MCVRTAVDEVETIGGTLRPEEEVSALAWFGPRELRTIRLNRFAKALLVATGHVQSVCDGEGLSSTRPPFC